MPQTTSQCCNEVAARAERSSEYLDRVCALAFEACRHRRSLTAGVAELPLRIRFSDPEVQSSLFRSLQHLRQSDSQPLLDVAIWSAPALDYLLDSAPWPVRGAWGKEEIVNIRCGHGFVAFDPQSEIISAYDREKRRAMMWTPFRSGHGIRVVGMPLAMILNWWLTEHGRLLCHASAVACDGAGVMIVGRGGSGKSTLAFTALDSSMKYLGDDFVVAQSDPAPRVSSIYNTGKLLPEHMRECFPRLNPHEIGLIPGSEHKKAVVFLAQTHADRVGLGAPLKGILLPVFSERTTAKIEAVGPAVAHRALAPSTVFQLPGYRKQRLTLLADLVKRVPTYRILLSRDLGANIGAIENFLNDKAAE